ncbi:hypothetical protein Tco_0535688 [Tanacetum coccineum]
MMEDIETKMDIETPYEKLKDNEKSNLQKDENKMILYDALLRNSQVKDYKIDLLTKKYEKFSISDEETIDSGFTRFNAIVTSLKSLDQDYSSKNHVRKWEINSNSEIDSVTRVIDLEEDVVMDLEIKAPGAQDKSVIAIITGKKVTSLVSVESPRKTRLLSEELGVIAKTAMNRKRTQHVSWQSTLKRFVSNVIDYQTIRLWIVVAVKFIEGDNISHDSIIITNAKYVSSLAFNLISVGRFNLRRIYLTGFPAQSVRSSNADALDSPYLLVPITGTSQSRQHVDTSLIHIESRKSPTVELFDVDSGRISIRHYEY